MNLKVLLSVIISIFLVAFFISIVYAVFNYNAVGHSNVISDMLQVLPTASDIGSFDWVLILIWDIALFLYFAFNALGAFYCFRQTFFKKWQIVSISLILVAIFAISLFTNFDIHNGIMFVTHYVWYFSLFAQYFIPLLLLIFSFRLKRRNNAKILLEK